MVAESPVLGGLYCNCCRWIRWIRWIIILTTITIWNICADLGCIYKYVCIYIYIQTYDTCLFIWSVDKMDYAPASKTTIDQTVTQNMLRPLILSQLEVTRRTWGIRKSICTECIYIYIYILWICQIYFQHTHTSYLCTCIQDRISFLFIPLKGAAIPLGLQKTYGRRAEFVFPESVWAQGSSNSGGL